MLIATLVMIWSPFLEIFLVLPSSKSCNSVLSWLIACKLFTSLPLQETLEVLRTAFSNLPQKFSSAKPLSLVVSETWLAIPQFPGVRLAVVLQQVASHSAGTKLFPKSSSPLPSSRSSVRALSPPPWDQKCGGEVSA